MRRFERAGTRTCRRDICGTDKHGRFKREGSVSKLVALWTLIGVLALGAVAYAANFTGTDGPDTIIEPRATTRSMAGAGTTTSGVLPATTRSTVAAGTT